MASYGVPSSVSQRGKIEPFELQLSRGQIAYHTPYFRFGWANTVGTTPQTVTTVVSAGAVYCLPNDCVCNEGI
jgi:hypothetical protein